MATQQQQLATLDKRISLLEQKIDILMNNHISHLAADVKQLHTMFKWGVGVVFVQLVGVIAMLLTQ